MESKMIAILSMFALVLLSLSIVSADSANGFEFTIVDDLPVNVNAGNTYSIEVRFNNTNVTYSEVNISFSGSDFDLPNDDTIASGSVGPYTMDLDVPSSESGSFSRVLTVEVTNGSEVLETLSVTFASNIPETTFCEDIGLIENAGTLEISGFDITNSGSGSDEEWDLLDEIEIEVIIENTDNDDDVDDVMVEIKILDENGNDVTDDFELDDEEIDLGRIRDDDEETAIFLIPEVPVDMDEGDYSIYVVAYSEDDDSCISEGNDLDDYGNSKLYAEFEIKKENDVGIIIKQDLTSMAVSCGQENVELAFELYNIGDDEEEKVLVTVYNSELGIDEKIVLNDFRSGKKKEVIVRFDVPENLDKSAYTLDIVTYFDWDDDEDEMDIDAYDENSEDDLDENYAVRLDILSCNEIGSSVVPIISAELVSEDVVVESEVLIRAMVTNPSSESQDFVLSVGNYESWAKLVSVQPTVLNVGAGQTGEVMIRIEPLDSGVQTFNIRVIGGDSDISQDVSLNVGEKPGFWEDFDGFGDDSLMYWVAVALVVLIVFLILLIIIVALRKR